MYRAHCAVIFAIAQLSCYITCLFTVIFRMMGQDVFRVTSPPKEVRPRANLCSYRLVLVAIGIGYIGLGLTHVLRKSIVVFTARSIAYVARYCHDKLSVHTPYVCKAMITSNMKHPMKLAINLKIKRSCFFLQWAYISKLGIGVGAQSTVRGKIFLLKK